MSEAHDARTGAYGNSLFGMRHVKSGPAAMLQLL